MRIVVGVPESIEVFAAEARGDWVDAKEPPDQWIVVALLHVNEPGCGIHLMPREPGPGLPRAIGRFAISRHPLAPRHRAGFAGLSHRAPQRVGVLVARARRRTSQPAAALGHQAAGQVDVVVPRRGLEVAGIQHLAGLAVVEVGRSRLDFTHPPAQSVVGVGVVDPTDRACGQPVRAVEGEAVVVADREVAAGQVAPRIVAHAVQRGAGRVLHCRQPIAGVVLVADRARALVELADVVEHVVGENGVAALRATGGDAKQAVQGVVAHRPVAGLARQCIGDAGNVAVVVVVVGVVQDLGGAQQVLAALRQAAGVGSGLADRGDDHLIREK